MLNSAIISAIAIIIALWSVIPACFWLGSSKTTWMPAFAGMTAILSLFFINPSFATTSHNLYDAKGNLIASCGEEGCEYFIYQGVSRTGVVKDNQFNHQANGLDGKTGEITHDQAGVKNSQLWVTDFHGSVVAKLTTKEPEIILFDAFGAVLNEEDCQDYHYTDKPRVGCTALHNFNARFYDPKLGRFTITDPVEQHNLNWFIYGNNNPLTFIDPDGNNPLRYKSANEEEFLGKNIEVYQLENELNDVSIELEMLENVVKGAEKIASESIIIVRLDGTRTIGEGQELNNMSEEIMKVKNLIMELREQRMQIIQDLQAAEKAIDETSGFQPTMPPQQGFQLDPNITMVPLSSVYKSKISSSKIPLKALPIERQQMKPWWTCAADKYWGWGEYMIPHMLVKKE